MDSGRFCLMIPFNSEFSVQTPEGSVSLEPSSEVLVPFNSEFAAWALEGSVLWFHLILSLLCSLQKVL